MTVADELRKRGLYDVAEDIARESHLTVGDMFACRYAPGPEARRKFYAYLRALGWGYPMIGKLCGRDHSTVMAALRAP